MRENGEIYTTGKNFTLLLALTALTNSNSEVMVLNMVTVTLKPILTFMTSSSSTSTSHFQSVLPAPTFYQLCMPSCEKEQYNWHADSDWVHGYHNTTAIIKPPGRRRVQTGFEDGGRAVHCGQFDSRGATKQTPVLSFDAHKLLC